MNFNMYMQASLYNYTDIYLHLLSNDIKGDWDITV